MVTDRGMIWGRSSAPGAVGLGCGVEHQAPVVRVLEQLGHGEGHRPAAGSGPRQPAGASRRAAWPARHPSRSRVPMVPATMASKTPWPDEPEGAGEGQDLVLGGVGAGHRSPGPGLVADGARRREPDRAGGHGLTDDGRHGGDVLGGGVLVGRAPLPHHVEAHRTVGDLGGDVDRVPSAVEQVEVLAERLPLAPGHADAERRARDVLDPLHQVDQGVVVRSDAPGRTRPRSCP